MGGGGGSGLQQSSIYRYFKVDKRLRFLFVSYKIRNVFIG